MTTKTKNSTTKTDTMEKVNAELAAKRPTKTGSTSGASTIVFKPTERVGVLTLKNSRYLVPIIVSDNLIQFEVGLNLRLSVENLLFSEVLSKKQVGGGLWNGKRLQSPDSFYNYYQKKLSQGKASSEGLPAVQIFFETIEKNK